MVNALPKLEKRLDLLKAKLTSDKTQKKAPKVHINL
jgi:hypothetical protein